ncbi:methyltransferase domain-containing protein [Pleomorphomonas oryzae]|uniref:methyltransferase domain-containing protein n=1 Tax=Pleomorphomonas oryzae TaxID=261934 RepID=UPI0004142699|nr:methyltransferase domain-containing protein [Pleomorphomonas oryzae]
MHSSQKWDTVRFHEALVELCEIKSGNHVLDLGCGIGRSLAAMLDAVGGEGKVVALDRMARSLADVASRFDREINDARLEVVQADVLATPFRDGQFDVVLCQNVVECVNEREALVAEAKRILRPGGRLLLGHHDFDGIILASEDRDLTRRLVHGFADHKQAWQDAAEGRMGRLLPGLVANAGFASVELEAKLFVDFDLSPGSYAGDYVRWLADLAPELGISDEDVAHWAGRLAADVAEGRFFFALPWIGAVCRKS